MPYSWGFSAPVNPVWSLDLNFKVKSGREKSRFCGVHLQRYGSRPVVAAPRIAAQTVNGGYSSANGATLGAEMPKAPP